MKRFYWLIIFVFLFIFKLNAQTNRITQLQQNIYKAGNETDKLNGIFLLLEEHQSMNRDTLDFYAYKALEMAAKTNDPVLKSKADIGLAADYYRWGWLDSLLVLANKGMQQNPVTHEESRKRYFTFNRFKAFCFAGRSKFEEALDVLYDLIRKAEEYRDTQTLCLNSNTIGSILLMRTETMRGLEWAKRAYDYTNEGNRFPAELAACYANMGLAYEQSGKYDSATLFLEKGLKLARQVENLNIQATILRYQSQLLIKQKLFVAAEGILKEMWDIRRLLVSENQYADDGLLLVEFYMETKQWKKAIDYCKKALLKVEDANALKIYNHITSDNIRKDYYEALAKCYKATGDEKAYTLTLEKLIEAREVYYKDNSEKAIAEMEVKYESEKQSGKIKDLENEKLRQQAGMQGLIKNFLLIVFILVAAILGYVIFTNRKLKKQNLELSHKNREIVLATSKGQRIERKRVASELHDNLNTKLAALKWRIEALDATKGGFSKEENLGGILQMLDDVYADVRLISHNMLPEELASKGLQVALVKLFEQLNLNPKTKFSLVFNNNDVRLDPEIEFELYQVTLELINNILKHAKASNVWLSFSVNLHKVSLSVSDDGIGFDPDRSSDGIGLRNIKSRLESLNGTCKIESYSGMGSKFSLDIPV